MDKERFFEIRKNGARYRSVLEDETVEKKPKSKMSFWKFLLYIAGALLISYVALIVYLFGLPEPHSEAKLKIDLSAKGIAEDGIFPLMQSGGYGYELQFYYARYEVDRGADRKRLIAFLKHDRNATKIPIKITITNYETNEIIIDQIYISEASIRDADVGGERLKRYIGAAALEAGVYRIKVDALEGFAFLKGREIYLSVNNYGGGKN